MSRSPSPRPPRSRERRKSTLFCRACGHENRIDGDWLVDGRPEGFTVTCPDCGAVVVDRPHPEADRPERSGSDALDAWLDAWGRLTREWFGLFERWGAFVTGARRP